MKITTLAQLEALPDGTVLKDAFGNFGEIFNKRIDLSEGDSSHIPEDADLILPATAYIPATITQEQFDQAAKAVRESEWFGTGYEQAYAALAAIGISVEGENE